MVRSQYIVWKLHWNIFPLALHSNCICTMSCIVYVLCLVLYMYCVLVLKLLTHLPSRDIHNHHTSDVQTARRVLRFFTHVIMLMITTELGRQDSRSRAKAIMNHWFLNLLSNQVKAIIDSVSLVWQNIQEPLTFNQVCHLLRITNNRELRDWFQEEMVIQASKG